MRILRFAVLAATLAGCSNQFESEAEEQAYLSSLSNPTPGQWKRLKALDEAEEGRRRDEADRRFEADRKAADATAETMAKDLWEQAEPLIGKDDKQAVQLCRLILKAYPRTSSAPKATAALDKLPYFEP